MLDNKEAVRLAEKKCGGYGTKKNMLDGLDGLVKLIQQIRMDVENDKCRVKAFITQFRDIVPTYDANMLKLPGRGPADFVHCGPTIHEITLAVDKTGKSDD